MNLFEILKRNTEAYPNHVIWEDEKYGKLSFFNVEEASSRIYAYLSEIGIGTEDVVAVRMTRSARIYLVMLGIWRSGAAFTVIGEHSPQNYVENVIADTEPKLIFDDDCFEKAVKCEPKEGYAKVDRNDLACIVYSTGSSGVFKGAMHEYGAIDNIIKKFEAAGYFKLYLKKDNCVTSRAIMTSGFYAISAVTSMLWSVVLGNYYFVISFDEINDFSKQVEIINAKHISEICVAPSNHERLKGAALPSLKAIFLSFDVSNDKLSDKYIYVNSYALTESFGTIISGFINKAERIVPVGKPCPYTEIMICDEDGQAVKDGFIGEVCFVPEYFRGYKNRPDLTAKVYHDGWFHTGDMGLVNEDGDYVILGRRIDMIKTKYGYIVPSYISSAVKREFIDIKDCYVKLFGNSENNKICVYYCSNKEHSINEITNKIKGEIPSYMLPTHCVKMDCFEYFPSGKIRRMSFEEPN